MRKPLLVFAVLSLIGIAWFWRAASWGESPLVYSTSSPWYDTGTNLNTVLFLSYTFLVLISFGYLLRRSRERRSGN